MTIIQSAYDRFCKKRFPLPSEEQVAALERRLGITFPGDYRRFLLEYNGGYFDDPDIGPVDGVPQQALDDLYGINASLPAAELGKFSDIHLFDGNDPLIILPIGASTLGGLILLDTTPDERFGAIYYKEPWGGSHWLAEGIEAFFALLRPAPPE